MSSRPKQSARGAGRWEHLIGLVCNSVRVPSDRKRSEEGTYEPETSDDEILKAMEVGEPYGTSEIVEMLDMPKSTVHYRLGNLAEDGPVRKKKIHERTVVWVKQPTNGGESA